MIRKIAAEILVVFNALVPGIGADKILEYTDRLYSNLYQCFFPANSHFDIFVGRLQRRFVSHDIIGKILSHADDKIVFFKTGLRRG